jgi:hypothetical protein
MFKPSWNCRSHATLYPYDSLSVVRQTAFLDQTNKGIPVVDQRKQAISIRLGENDVRNVKRIAKRLGVRDSDIIRFAVKSMLGRIAPLCDEAIAGRNLVPVLIESGDELIRYFELDSYRLESIINEHADDELRVERDDIALLAMGGLRDQYLVMRMNQGHGALAEAAVPTRSLRNYLYDKYVHRSGEAKPVDGKLTLADGDSRNSAQRPAA